MQSKLHGAIIGEEIAQRPYAHDVLNFPGSEVAGVHRVICKEHGFDKEISVKIATLSLEEALQTARSYLARTGLGADKILAQFMEK